MDRCDVLIVGGGPAGSSCARRLVRSGLDVVVLDRARFPRDKVCAGWITPAVVRALELDLDDYRLQQTLQPFFGFRTGTLTQSPLIATSYDTPVSYGIRRCEFDTYLLRRSGARLRLGEPLTRLQKDADGWLVNGTIRATVVVGAGGHFCPVARHFNPRAAADNAELVVVAQETERPLDAAAAASCRIEPGMPALYFWPDLMGYGWCVRKGEYVNVGVGRLTQSQFPKAVADFKQALESRGDVPAELLGAWKGHAYLLDATSTRQIHDDGALLVGDAAGLALAPSGEGILAAVESGLMAANVLIDAAGNYSKETLAAYAAEIDRRFGRFRQPSWLARTPSWLLAAAGTMLLRSQHLTQRWLLERAFLHQDRAPLGRTAIAGASTPA